MCRSGVSITPTSLHRYKCSQTLDFTDFFCNEVKHLTSLQNLTSLQIGDDIMADDISKSWFCVFNNPDKHGYEGTPEEICERLKNEWITDKPTRSGAWIYCISADGLKHIHMVLEDTKAMRFSVIKKSYAVGMHFEPTRGSKEQAENYINKKGRFEEKGEQIVYSTRHGEIKGSQGSRRDLSLIDDLLDSGKTPDEIFAMNLQFRRYENMINREYLYRKQKEVPFIRDVKVVYHVGESGTGKTFCANKIIEEHGENELYFVSDYSDGGMDTYNGQKFLFLDEFRGQLRFSTLLGWLDKYKIQIHARYSNKYALWNEVHICTVYPPELLYESMVSDNRKIDTQKQLFRRINTIVYHWKDNSGYNSYELDMKKYVNYEDLKDKACGQLWLEIPEEEPIPFS